ncbi:MAG: glycosyltransferase family 4 protein [Actinobacteria bacterium]|nr:glycosyltransferase family 4 protein [Actinomycetota bacterium]
MKVAVLTTSYPRDEDDHLGRFVADGVERLRAAGIAIEVVGPQAFRHFGLAYGEGVVPRLRRRPWLGPPLLVSMAAALRRAACEADLVHVHWLQNAVAALAIGKPYVVTLHGTDMALAAKAPAFARPLVRRARRVIAVSSALAEEARRLGARDVRVIPNGIDVPPSVGDPAEPPHVLFAGRLAPEKGVEELAEATQDLPLVVAGDGPLRGLVPQTRGFVPRAELDRLYEEAAVVACPSRREGFGVVCAEAMARGRPVVASAVGGLLDLVRDEETGLLVPPRDPLALRTALERLLRDAELRARLGASAREHVARHCSWDAVTDATLAVYREAVME